MKKVRPPPKAAHPDKIRTVTCRHWKRGHCELGSKCNFRHDSQGLPATKPPGKKNSRQVHSGSQASKSRRLSSHDELDLHAIPMHMSHVPMKGGLFPMVTGHIDPNTITFDHSHDGFSPHSGVHASRMGYLLRREPLQGVTHVGPHSPILSDPPGVFYGQAVYSEGPSGLPVGYPIPGAYPVFRPQAVTNQNHPNRGVYSLGIHPNQTSPSRGSPCDSSESLGGHESHVDSSGSGAPRWRKTTDQMLDYLEQFSDTRRSFEAKDAAYTTWFPPPGGSHGMQCPGINRGGQNQFPSSPQGGTQFPSSPFADGVKEPWSNGGNFINSYAPTAISSTGVTASHILQAGVLTPQSNALYPFGGLHHLDPRTISSDAMDMEVLQRFNTSLQPQNFMPFSECSTPADLASAGANPSAFMPVTTGRIHNGLPPGSGHVQNTASPMIPGYAFVPSGVSDKMTNARSGVVPTFPAPNGAFVNRNDNMAAAGFHGTMPELLRSSSDDRIANNPHIPRTGAIFTSYVDSDSSPPLDHRLSQLGGYRSPQDPSRAMPAMVGNHLIGASDSAAQIRNPSGASTPSPAPMSLTEPRPGRSFVQHRTASDSRHSTSTVPLSNSVNSSTGQAPLASAR